MDELLAEVIQLYNVQLSKLRGRFLQISAAFSENLNFKDTKKLRGRFLQISAAFSENLNFKDIQKNTHIYEFLPDMRFVVGIWIICVHVFDGTIYSLWVQSVIVLHNMISDHYVKKRPSNIVIWCQGLIVICGIEEKKG